MTDHVQTLVLWKESSRVASRSCATFSRYPFRIKYTTHCHYSRLLLPYFHAFAGKPARAFRRPFGNSELFAEGPVPPNRSHRPCCCPDRPSDGQVKQLSQQGKQSKSLCNRRISKAPWYPGAEPPRVFDLPYQGHRVMAIHLPASFWQ